MPPSTFKQFINMFSDGFPKIGKTRVLVVIFIDMIIAPIQPDAPRFFAAIGSNDEILW
jgi:hypothetical protein